MLQQPGRPGNQRRLVHISPRGMFPASQVIKLIAEVSVMRPGHAVERHARQRKYNTIAIPEVKREGPRHSPAASAAVALAVIGFHTNDRGNRSRRHEYQRSEEHTSEL